MNLNSSLQKTPIAVIGLSSIFADARNVEEFWTNIIQSKDSIIDVPANRWLIEDYYDADMFAPDKTYCKRGGFLPEIDFNPMEFGLPPNILEVTDASQLLGLVAARDAFEDAGYGQKSAKFTAALKEKTGVLLGVGGGQKLITPLIARLQYPIWERALRASGVSEDDIPRIVDKMKKAYVSWNENAFPGLLGNVISGRITNRFDLGGINSVVDAACAASLSAIKMALSELVEGRCDMMLTGGVDTDNSPFMYMSFSKTPAFSKSGNISPFSDAADGMLIGEGMGMLVLKRLSDAERDGDQIYATITGVGTSSDGRFKSVYAPRPAGQALAMNRAYEDAGYAPSTVGLLEGHGTGTGAGDPTEFTSMQMVFGANNPKKQHIALGSVKSQIGHTKSAAGAAGIIKMVLALHHKVLPPTINVEKPNHKFDIENSAMYINTQTRPWMRNGHPRRAGVSAFGFGGINVHITLEEYQGKKNANYRMHEPYKSIILQADSPTLLQQNCQALLAELQGENADLAFENVVRTSKNQVLNTNQPRLGFVVNTISECIDFLQLSIQNLKTPSSEWMHPKGIFYRNQSIDTTKHKLVALFAGQGAQYVGMGAALANAFPEIADTFAKADELYVKNGEKALSSSIFPIPVFTKEEKEAQQKALTQTQNAQPAIGTLSMGQYKVLQNAGFAPHFAAGHSFGELTALWAAGSYDDATFLALAKSRGAAMASQHATTDAGAMLAVKATQDQVQQAIAQLTGVQIANVNSNNQIILGGSTSAIQTAEIQLKNQGFSVVSLPVAAAFHTPFVAHAQQPFAAFLEKQVFDSPKIPVFANSTGQAYPSDVASLKNILENQILNPVLFKNQIENIHAAGGRIFVEFGPKGILTALVKNILENKEHTAIALNANAQKDSDLQFRQAVVQMQVLGLSLKNVDPYKKEMTPLPPKSKMTVKLSGNNYVAADTQKAYDDVMTDGFKIKGGGTQIVEKVVEKIVNVEKIVEKIVEVPTKNGLHTTDKTMQKETLHLLQETLNAFKANQAKALAVFEGFMTEQNHQGQQIIQLLAQQLAAQPGIGAEPVALPTTVKGAPYYANTPVETLDKTPLVTNGSSNGKAQNVQTTTTAIATQTAITQAPSTVSNSTLTAQLLEVVSEKTGYPAEMLELGMDMEADLGIDSIKRVEIFGALTQQNPEMSSINPNELTELRTLQEIVDYVSAQTGRISAPAANSSTTVQTQAVQTVAVSNGTVSAPTTQSNSTLTAQLLEVVSEKTGYPAEMLELGMDMEADLGIDSIKRVEIFGALTQQNPEMSSINPNELTELRTLQEIVDYVSAQTGMVSAPAANSSTTVQTQAVQTVAVSNGTVSAPTTQSNSTLTAQLLEVVSEKTGYPAEMLELGMDMEADLGIDSIKRVEIFGALTQQNPEMSSINPNELTELRTLQEIVDYVSTQTGRVSAPAAKGSTTVQTIAQTATVSTGTGSAPTAQSNSNLTAQLLEVLSEKTGYPAEMLELGMDMEADLGIDSIKRVEIFGALTQQNPQMSSINPNELTELRTLQEIVDYVSAQTGSVSNNVSNGQTQAVQTSTPAAQPKQKGVDLEILTTMLLEVVSEKTGYPAEMLELGMDMEADLGIDSIKRVEIFGALTQQYPEMSGINPNELTELRTLAEIVDYVGSNKKKVSALNSEKEIVQTKAPVSTLGMVKTGVFHKVNRFEVGLEFLPQPDFLEFSLPKTHHVLVTNEGTNLTKKVIAALQADGMSVLVLNLPNVKNPIVQHAVNLAAATDEAIAQAVETIHAQYGKIGSFIHLHPHFEFQPGHFTQHFSAEKAIVKTLFFLAKHIQKDLNELGKTQGAKFLSFTRMDGQLGQGKRGNTSIVGGGIPGLVKCLNLEWSPVFCRAVDIQPELSADLIAKHVISEFHDANTRIVEVAVSKEARKTTSVKAADAPEFQQIQTRVTADSVFFVSGGARGVTATCVVEMAKTFQCKFILLGRSSSTFEVPAFAKNESDEGTLKRLIMNDLKEKGEKPSLAVVKNVYNEIVAKKEIDETLAEIANFGGKAIYIKGDVTKLSSFKQELDQATAQVGNITGIIHGAGRLADKYIQDKTEADFENVLSVKLDGLLALLGSVNLNQLDHLILFSSVAGFYGNVGQTDYAIANEILSRAAHLFRTNHPKTQVSAINWGAWDSGMVSGELKAQFEAAGISLVNSEGGAAMLVNELNTAYADQPQVIIGGTLPAAVSYIGDLRTYRIHRNLTLEQNPYLNHHVIQGNPVLPVVNAVGWMAQSCELLYPDFAVFKIENTKLFKGLVFDGKTKTDYILEVKEIKKTAEKVVFETTVLSEGRTLPSFHYKATVILMHKKAIPSAPRFTHKVSGNYTPTDGAILYKDDTLFHGAYFQGIQQVLDCNAEQIVLSCKAPEVPLSVQGQFAVQSINTFFADIQYQGMLVWVAKNKDKAKSLPLQTDDAIIYKQVPFGKELFVHIGIQSHSETQMTANCTVYDAEGTVYIETNGASVTISKGLTW